MSYAQLLSHRLLTAWSQTVKPQNSKSKRTASDSDKDSCKLAIKKLTADRDRIGVLMERMQQSQAQQLKLMEGLLGSFKGLFI